MPGAESPFRIIVPEEKILHLKQKLTLTVFPGELEDAGWDYGVPLADVKRLFTRDIEVDGHGTLNIHYVHKKSEVERAIPLLFVHGWPDSIIEVHKILPLLTQASLDHPSFHVVAFSLPGYGFSEAPKRKGFAANQFAEVGHKLMVALGYNEYVTQGGDWGALITRKIALAYGGKHAKAWHTNIPLAPPPHPIHRPWLLLAHFLWGYSAEEKKGLEKTMKFHEKGSGYNNMHSTQPQTIGYPLADSPAGLLAWIYEKLVIWTDNYPWDDDEVLTWISIYWFSRAEPAASVRIYYEVDKTGGFADFREPTVTIPTGYSYFPKEIMQLPRRWFKTRSLIFESKHDSGGHFAAHEKPEELVGDLRKMFGKGGPAHSIAPGKIGYRL